MMVAAAIASTWSPGRPCLTSEAILQDKANCRQDRRSWVFPSACCSSVRVREHRQKAAEIGSHPVIANMRYGSPGTDCNQCIVRPPPLPDASWPAGITITLELLSEPNRRDLRMQYRTYVCLCVVCITNSNGVTAKDSSSSLAVQVELLACAGRMRL